jgi:hypothetical protein
MMRIAFIGLLLAVASVPSALDAQAPGASFDHFTTGFDLEGAHLTLECEACHVAGVFQGTPTECGACHSSTGRIQAEAKPVDHVFSSEFCEDCHRTTVWFPLAQMNHDAIFGSCTTCHNNVQSVGKPPQHPPTSQECDTCHRTTSWFPVFFDHAEVTQSCITCHDGVGATGKHAAHITTTNVCEDCHTTAAWTPANFNHDNISGNCVSCHNGTTSTGKPTNHFGTQLECDNCHSRTAWTPLTFQHSSANYPGDHVAGLTCTDCHTSNAEIVPWQFPAYAPDCAACHALDYRPGPHNNASVSELRDCAGSCHQSSPEHSVRSREW